MYLNIMTKLSLGVLHTSDFVFHTYCVSKKSTKSLLLFQDFGWNAYNKIKIVRQQQKEG